MEHIPKVFIFIVEFGIGVLTLLFAAAVIAAAFLYVVDRRQTTHAIRRNYPVIGRFRYLFEHMGEFF